MLRFLRRHLGWKLLLSYMVIIFVGIIVLASATEFVIPSAFDRHLAAMNEIMMENRVSADESLESDLFANFRSAVNDALTFATIAAFLSAVTVSVLVSRQIVGPVRQMLLASQHIAQGNFEERVSVPGDVARDEVDELGQLAISFNRMASQLEQTEVMRQQLIGDVAHELRTPLTTIKGSMEGLIDGVLPPKQDTFQYIYHEADRLQRLVSDLQELSRVEMQVSAMRPGRLQARSLIQSAVDRLKNQFEEKGVDLNWEVEDHLPTLWADEDRIGQILLNILGNALQYTPQGGKVDIRVRRKEDEVHFRIEDSGIGISPEHLPHIFKRFYRVDKSRSRISGGTGIGLTIARQLVKANGGRIWAESTGDDQGSTFTFTLPILGLPEEE